MEEQIFSLDEEEKEAEESEETPAGPLRSEASEPEARLDDPDEEDGEEAM
ncbi:MAG TPA: hypothetical protein VJC15_00045 [Candidatus Paceibacterota bacterium]